MMGKLASVSTTRSHVCIETELFSHVHWNPVIKRASQASKVLPLWRDIFYVMCGINCQLLNYVSDVFQHSV